MEDPKRGGAADAAEGRAAIQRDLRVHSPQQENTLQEERARNIGLMLTTLHPRHGRSHPEREQIRLGCQGKSRRVQRRGGKRHEGGKRNGEAVLLFPHQDQDGDPFLASTAPSLLAGKIPSTAFTLLALLSNAGTVTATALINGNTKAALLLASRNPLFVTAWENGPLKVLGCTLAGKCPKY